MTWMDNAADEIRSQWIEWEAEAGQASQREQDSRAGEQILHDKITECIRKHYPRTNDAYDLARYRHLDRAGGVSRD